jgi:hypothetical protein
MNRQDFCRNFQISYFGYLNTNEIRNQLEKAGHNTAIYALGDGVVTPVTRPGFPTSTRAGFVGIVVLKYADGSGYESFSIPICNWVDDMDETAEFMTDVPPSQMVQLDDTAVYVRRIPHRETPRGFCPRSSPCHIISGEVVRPERSELMDSSRAEVIWNIYNPRQSVYTEAIKTLNSGDTAAVVLASHLSLGFKPNRRHLQLFYRNQGSVGFVDEQGIPTVFPSFATLASKDYIRKVTGIYPREK